MKLEHIPLIPEDPCHEPVAATGARGVVRPFPGTGMDAFHRLKQDMDDFEDTIEDVKCFGGPDAVKKVGKLVKTMRDFTPSVTVIGQIKSGKTSLVNAMAGMPGLLPADVNPWTSVVTSLHLNRPLNDAGTVASFQMFDRDEWDFLIQKGGRLGELSSRAGASKEEQKVREQILEMREKTKARLGRRFELLLGQRHDYEELSDDLMQRYICMGDDFGDPEDQDPAGQFAEITKSADLYLEAPALPLPLCIRDTPGVNDTFMMREQVTINALRNSRICIVVLSASQALNTVDLGLIRLISNVKSREIVIFVNRIDELADPATEVDKIGAWIRRTLEENNGPKDVKLIFGSAHWANRALLDQAGSTQPGSAPSLADYADAKGVHGQDLTPSALWKLSGLPELFEAVGERIAVGQGREILNSVRRRARNYVLGLKASSSIVSLRLSETELEMVDTKTLQIALEQTKKRAIEDLSARLEDIFATYCGRVDQAHGRYLDRALESLTDHLENNGEDALWEYSPDGLRLLLRSGYQMMRRKVGKACDAVLQSSADEISQIYLNMFSVDIEGFAMKPPQTPAFPPPASLGQTIALDLKSAFWSEWWQRRKSSHDHASEFRALIEAETENMINDMKVGQIDDIRKIALAHLDDFLSEQTSILTDVTQKSQISVGELNNLFGITEQDERDELFDIIMEDFSLAHGAKDEGDDPDTDQAPRRTRPTRPVSVRLP